MAEKYPGFDASAMLAQINASLNRHVQGMAKSVLGYQRIGEIAAASLAPFTSGVRQIATPQLDWVAGFTRDFGRIAEEALAEFRRSLPPNLRHLDGVEFTPILALADEGITLWAVPRAQIADRLLRAQTTRARRRILGSSADDILHDCSVVAVAGAAGPYADLARLLEQAIRVIRAGELAAGQALAASVLDTLMRVSFTEDDRKRLIAHKRSARSQVTPVDHFDEYDFAFAMVMRPVWFAYRPQDTAEQRAASSTFARHGSAHHIRGRQVSKRNAVQSVMLAAALLDLLAVLDRERS
ncbi:hypothetical protein [Cellulomonas triticagri]|uniref:Uncharacterized protein n=1 Tax=Cellulomonas triticagri TaxID=2483352 RepID=A0A3M2JLU7_9CELL|nr:hypothetical protein [Cellulomonas triticagri]RMI13236.1 hypothetical protein EBM89_05275 [Cellulomonas triticagri]